MKKQVNYETRSGACGSCEELGSVFRRKGDKKWYCRECYEEIYKGKIPKVHAILGCGNPTCIWDDDEDPSTHNARRVIEG